MFSQHPQISEPSGYISDLVPLNVRQDDRYPYHRIPDRTSPCIIQSRLKFDWQPSVPLSSHQPLQLHGICNNDTRCPPTPSNTFLLAPLSTLELAPLKSISQPNIPTNTRSDVFETELGPTDTHLLASGHLALSADQSSEAGQIQVQQGNQATLVQAQQRPNFPICILTLVNLPPECTRAKVLEAIRHCGKIQNIGFTSRTTIKLKFAKASGATNFLAQLHSAPGVLVGSYRLFLGAPSEPGLEWMDPAQTRVLCLRGFFQIHDIMHFCDASGASPYIVDSEDMTIKLKVALDLRPRETVYFIYFNSIDSALQCWKMFWDWNIIGDRITVSFALDPCDEWIY